MIEIKGHHFFNQDARFIIKGLVYQPQQSRGPVSESRDPLCDERLTELRQNIDLIKDLGINALWIYFIDPTLSHDAAMSLLSAHDIYIIACLPSIQKCIHRNNPRQSYTDDVKSQYACVMDCLAQYDNVIGVCASNVLVNANGPHSDLVQEVHETIGTVVRDMKRYMRLQKETKGQRILPICIADTKEALLHTSSFEYLTDKSRSDAHTSNETEGIANKEAGDDTIDFYCFTCYDSSTSTSTSASTTKPKSSFLATTPPDALFSQLHLLPKFHNTPTGNPSIPILLSEYSDYSSTTRSFSQVTHLYSTSPPSSTSTSTPPVPTPQPLMSDIFSGGFLYEYSEGANRYGLVDLRTPRGAEEREGERAGEERGPRLLRDYQAFKERLARACS